MLVPTTIYLSKMNFENDKNSSTVDLRNLTNVWFPVVFVLVLQICSANFGNDTKTKQQLILNLLL